MTAFTFFNQLSSNDLPRGAFSRCKCAKIQYFEGTSSTSLCVFKRNDKIAFSLNGIVRARVFVCM